MFLRRLKLNFDKIRFLNIFILYELFRYDLKIFFANKMSIYRFYT